MKTKRQQRKWKAWAVVNTGNGNLVMWDYRLPLMWLRQTAKRDNEERRINGKIIRVEIRELRRGSKT